MSAGCLCWLDKQNTVAAYFTPVPVCQAVCGEEGYGSKHNGMFDTVVCFLAIWLCLFHWQGFIKTVSLSPTSPSQRATMAQSPTSCKDTCELFFINNSVAYLTLPQFTGPNIHGKKRKSVAHSFFQ